MVLVEVMDQQESGSLTSPLARTLHSSVVQAMDHEVAYQLLGFALDSGALCKSILFS